MEKELKEEVKRRLKMKIEEKFGDSSFRWSLLLYNVLFFIVIYLVTFLIWGTSSANQFLLGGVVVAIVGEYIFYMVAVNTWRRNDIPTEIYREKNKRIEELEQVISKPISIFTSHDTQEKNGDYILKRIKVINQSYETLFECMADIYSFYKETGGESLPIQVVTNQISWSEKGRKKSGNKVNLKHGVEEILDIFKIDSYKNIFLIGEDDNNTPIEETGTYKIDIILYSGDDSFPSHLFNIKFYCYAKDRIEIKEVTKPSKIEMLYSSGKGTNLPINFNGTTKKQSWIQRIFKK